MGITLKYLTSHNLTDGRSNGGLAKHPGRNIVNYINSSVFIGSHVVQPYFIKA